MRKELTAVLLCVSLIFSVANISSFQKCAIAQPVDTAVEILPDSSAITSDTEIIKEEAESWSKKVIHWYMNNLNYFSLTVLMIIESSFIPFPSEVVIPPAAWKAAEGELNLFLVIFFSTLGALIGALINYFISISLGRAIIYKFADTRFAHFLLIDSEKVHKAEAYFIKHGRSSTLIGRLIPAIRQLISIPAGLAKMKLSTFIGFTCLGATIWNIILAIIGYFLYSQKEVLDKYYNELSIALIILGILFVAYLVYSGTRNKKTAKNNPLT